jgi:type VI secretion system protein ImpK
MAEDDDPFARPDATRLRPRPGAGRRGANEPPRPTQVAPSWSPGADPIPDTARDLLGIGLNPLVQAASPLLLLAGQLRSSLTPFDVVGLRQHALEEIRRFEENARSAGIRNEVVLTARYVLCAALDEAVLATPWGAQSDWSQHSLLVALHREAWGGEKFFEMVDRISADPGRHIDLMELQYLVLAFGFSGKYQVLDRGHERLADVQNRLYRKIRDYRGGSPETELSLRWRGLEDRRNPLLRFVPWWVVGAAALAIIALVYTAYYTGIASFAAPVHAELAKVGLEDFTPLEVAPPVPRGPTLKQLLAPEEQAGTLSVEEQPGRTVVTLLSRNLFASGSAEVNPSSFDALQRLAKALNQVPGRVLVVGHTDDQRLKSLRYQDNFELSRERAVSVVRMLEQTVDNRTKLNWTGVGSTEPRYRPESDPENQARNRRVEIIHVAGS